MELANISPDKCPTCDNMASLLQTVAQLRSPDGCPWDREQTHKSIAGNLVEEAYEAVDAIEAENAAHMKEELGDVLLQVIMQSQMAFEEGLFSIDDVAAELNAKLIRRHPHVFGDVAAGDAQQVLEIWDSVKLQEHTESDAEQSLLDSVSVKFPALLQAQKISRKAVSAGFEWDTLDDVWAQVAEEKAELEEAYAAGVRNSEGKLSKSANEEAYAQAEMEMGDLLFSLVNVSRRMGINAEDALRASCAKFRRRWAVVEQMARDKNVTVADCSTEELNELWNRAKKDE